MSRPAAAEFAAVLRRGAHPPVREAGFWVVQAMVVLIAGVHLLVDLNASVETRAFPVGIPVALLIVPVAYAALRYGLAGSAATGIWATLLWLPDLLLPHDGGHVGGDLVDLALVDFVALFVGQRIEAERLIHTRVEHATAERLTVEASYRQLFETNGSPILVLDAHGVVRDANPAAKALLGAEVIGRSGGTLAGMATVSEAPDGRRVELPDGRDYRIDLVPLPASRGAAYQLVLEDVTAERSEGRRATRYAQLVVHAEEEQRRRLSRELHDEPLQLFLHLARRLESLGGVPGVPAEVSVRLAEARGQALDAAARLRTAGREPAPAGSRPARSGCRADQSRR